MKCDDGRAPFSSLGEGFSFFLRRHAFADTVLREREHRSSSHHARIPSRQLPLALRMSSATASSVGAARAYLDEHNILCSLKTVIARVLRDAPHHPDPVRAVAEALCGGSCAVDKFECPLAGPSAATAAVIEYQRCVLAYARFEQWGEIVGAAAAFPDAPMAQLLAADFLQQQAGGTGPAGDEKLAAAEAALAKLSGAAADASPAADRMPVRLSPPPPTREHGYLAALRATASGDLVGAYDAWLAVVREFPFDLFAVKRGQFTCIMTGRSAQLLEIAQAARRPPAAIGAGKQGPVNGAASSLGRYYDGILAFGLEQVGDVRGAEAAARRGLAEEAALLAAHREKRSSRTAAAAAAVEEEGGEEEEREDGWLQHGLCHALYFQDKHEEAVAFLRERSGRWPRRAWHPFLYTHLWWHLALLHAEMGEADAALAIFDGQLWNGEDEGDMEVQLNALGLLVRLRTRGVANLAPRWAAVLDGIERSGPKDYIHAYPLHNLLRLAALCVCGRDHAPLTEGLAAAAEAAKETNPKLGEVVVPLAAALVRLLGGGGGGADDEDAAAARAEILALKGGASCWAPVAGSEEQRGFLLELAAGPVRAGKAITAS